ncbi:MAG: thiol protease/hemagglutinin PrtT [Muribaculaceae bacterium]|nr:thiol protease/hemagglutinin PrtT [Muribaculaceae bacterium]
MTRKLFLALPLLSAAVCMAAPISPEQALNRVANNGLVSGTRGLDYLDPVMTKMSPAGLPSLYVFQESEKPGFMILSADDAVNPVLGYSDWNSLDVDNLPPALEYWLDQYTAQIEFMRENPSLYSSFDETGVSLPSNWNAIAPIIKTKWNQSEPYYNSCPTYNGVHCNTGCVATSMSQVMKHFNYPAKGQGSISYKCASLNQILTIDFSTLTFDWNNMLNSYSNGNYNDAQAKAVADLMMAAGYATEMQYSTGTSGTQSGKILSALINNFNYDLSMRFLKRENFTYTEWATMIYNNLANVGPVIYDGTSFNPDGTSSIGHSFICDGYQGDGYFHFNWGWGGSSDGYFLLDALNPPSLGIGGGSGGFNYSQDIVLGIQPAKSGTSPTAQKEVVIYGSVQGLTTSNQLRIGLEGPNPCGWAFIGYDKIVVDLGGSFVPVSNPNATPIYLTSSNEYNVNAELEPGEYMPPTNSGANLRPTFLYKDLAPQLQKNTKYKVTNVYKNSDGGNWQEVGVDVGSYNYFYLTVTGDGLSQSDYQIENFDPMQFTCSSLSLDTELYNGIAVEVSATVTNSNDTELTRGLCLALLDNKGNINFLGSCTQLSLAAGEKYSSKWVTSLYNQTSTSVTKATDFYPALYDPTTNTIYYTSNEAVTMEPNPGTPSYSVTLEVDDAERVNRVYQVKDAANFEVTTTIKVSRNIFSVPTQLWVAYQSGGYWYPILTYPYEQIIVNKGETATIQTKINFPTAQVGNEYGLVFYDVNTKSSKANERFLVLGDSGVDELWADKAEINFFQDKASQKLYLFGEVASVEVYSINGMKLSSAFEKNADNASIDLSTLGKGIVIVKATDSKGKTASLKLAL